MRVVHCLRILRGTEGGVVRAVTELASRFATKGSACCVVTLKEPEVPPGWHPVKADDPASAFSSGAVTVATARSPVGWSEILKAADVVHIHQPLQPMIAAATLVCRRVGTPYVVSPHGVLDEWPMEHHKVRKRMYWSVVGWRMMGHAAAIHMTSAGEREQGHEWIPHSAIWTIPLFIPDAPDTNTAHVEPCPPESHEGEGPLPGEGGRAPTVLFLSRLDPKKGADIFLEAIKILRDSGLRLRAVVAGPGEEGYVGRLRRQAEQLGIENVVEFVGFVWGAEKAGLLTSADLFVLPTAQENFGYAALEALQHGTPVVTTAGMDLWPELLHSGAGFLADRDALAIATQMASLLRDPEGTAQLGENGRRWVAAHFDNDATYRCFERFYYSAISDQPEAPRA